MKQNIHPELFTINARCACGHTVKTISTIPEIEVTICSACHPFYTGAQKFVDSEGRIEKFNKRFKRS